MPTPNRPTAKSSGALADTPHPLRPEHERCLHAANADACDYYRDQLLAPVGAGARGYLHHRRLEPVLDEASIWRVGYAPPGWTRLTDHLRGLGYTDRTLLHAGLAQTCRRGTLIDRFRDRLVVPIHAHTGGIIGFIARAAPAAPAGCPKYLNTPTTPLYRKSDTVFGLHEQLDLLDAGANPVIVEGPLDVIATNPGNRTDGAQLAPLSVCGTALTPMQAAAIAAVTTPDAKLILALDDDAAGRTATQRATTTLNPLRDRLRNATARLAGHDPASYARQHGTERLRQTLRF